MREWVSISSLIGLAVYGWIGGHQSFASENPWLQEPNGRAIQGGPIQGGPEPSQRSTSSLESTAKLEGARGASAGTASARGGSKMQIDHVILATNDLESGLREFEDLTGVRPTYGGSHPDRDTHNAIASLPGGMYLEILAPKDELEAVPAFFKNFHRLTLVGFAIATPDIERVEGTVRDLGLETHGIESGSRTTPDGGTLAWHLLLIHEPESFMNPFFISWSKESEHPSRMQPPRCTLENLTLTTPHKKQIERILSENGGEIQALTLVEGAKKLTLELETPKGRVTFGF